MKLMTYVAAHVLFRVFNRNSMSQLDTSVHLPVGLTLSRSPTNLVIHKLEFSVFAVNKTAQYIDVNN